MAVPPTIPTSFVPHPTSSGGGRRMQSDITGAFTYFSYFIFTFAVFSAFGVFGYDRFLAAREDTKKIELANVQATLDPETVTRVVRLRDRLSLGNSLLNEHVALSNLFHLLETTLPNSVRFLRLSVSIDPEGRATLSAFGVAKNFNALAAASDALAADARIRNAIFSGVRVTTVNAVEFSLSASIDRNLITFNSPAPTPEPVLPASEEDVVPEEETPSTQATTTTP